MKEIPEGIKILDVTAENVSDTGIFCIKDAKSPGYKSKIEWFKSKINNGLKIKIALDNNNKQLGFVEYIPSELAWRPVNAANYLFIHCIAMFVKEAKKKGVGSILLNICQQDAMALGKSGVCALSSDGPWMANKSIFEKNGFIVADKLDRFELMIKALDKKNPKPHFNNWIKEQSKYKGWNLIYSDQCPWHEKSVTDLKQCALDHGIKLKVKKLTTPEEAQKAPSGFGTFSLIKDGKLLGDHYLSRTRFESILNKEYNKNG
jgi:hypothetical protein